MSEEQIERFVEHAFDRLDAKYMDADAGISETEYMRRSREISEWADRQYAATKAGVASALQIGELLL